MLYACPQRCFHFCAGFYSSVLPAVSSFIRSVFSCVSGIFQVLSACINWFLCSWNISSTSTPMVVLAHRALLSAFSAYLDRSCFFLFFFYFYVKVVCSRVRVYALFLSLPPPPPLLQIIFPRCSCRFVVLAWLRPSIFTIAVPGFRSWVIYFSGVWGMFFCGDSHPQGIAEFRTNRRLIRSSRFLCVDEASVMVFPVLNHSTSVVEVARSLYSPHRRRYWGIIKADTSEGRPPTPENRGNICAGIFYLGFGVLDCM